MPDYRFRGIAQGLARHTSVVWLLVSLVVGYIALAVFTLPYAVGQADTKTSVADPCPDAQPVPAELRIPAKLQPGEPIEFEKQVLQYLNTLKYRKLGWCEDKWVRDTGPFMKRADAIVHPPVRIFYSKEVADWLLGDRKDAIPDGAVIIKEQFAPTPAARYRDIPDDKLGCSNDWTFMIKNSSASRDGWFWGEVWNSETYPMNFTDPFQYPNAGYGLYCLRCHASAEKEHTFATLNNIKGARGWPLQYRVDDSWMAISADPPPEKCGHGKSAADPVLGAAFPMHAQNATLDAEPVHYHAARLAMPAAIQKMPPEPLDNVVARPLSGKAGASADPSKSPEFVTSAQCLGCHSGLANSGLGPSMVVLPDVNVSPYGEWRWSPMGLAGRDPVFYSQLDSELAYLKDQPPKRQMVVNTCMNCHGAMGKKAFAAEHPDENFSVDFVYATNPVEPGFKYGGLARDGISCMVCHRMAAPKDRSLSYFLANKINGNFDLTPPDRISGPFKDELITVYPMDTGLGVTPKYDPYIESSQMCGSCHTIVLPVLDAAHAEETSVEQATYPEWLNSQYRNEYGSVGATPKSCQDCHMPAGYANKVKQIQTRMAIVQDLTLPATEHLAKPDQLNVRFRSDGFRRHELLGNNGFLLQMFLQPVDKLGNNEILGTRTKDYMTGFTTDLAHAVDNVVQQAQNSTATLAITRFEVKDNQLIADVRVSNHAGHRFPSGVGFRRAFLEFQATMNGQPFWTSGATNEKGEIVDVNGKVLPTEFFLGGRYQPHFSQSHPIKSTDQVQIYEELVQDANRQFTTSFTRRDFEIKDNRLLPAGWSEHGPADLKIPEQFLEATWPKGAAKDDPVYLAGKGQSIVRYEIPLPAGATAENVNVTVSLYVQSIPPYFLADRFKTPAPATGRLRHLTMSLGKLSGTSFANWKLLIASVKR